MSENHLILNLAKISRMAIGFCALHIELHCVSALHTDSPSQARGLHAAMARPRRPRRWPPRHAPRGAAPSRRCWPTRRGRARARDASRAGSSAELLDREQRATHGLAWLATYVEAVRQLAAYAERMQRAGVRRDRGALVRIGLGEYSPRSRRHSDEPERDRAPGRSRPRARRRSPRGSRRRSRR